MPTLACLACSCNALCVLTAACLLLFVPTAYIMQKYEPQVIKEPLYLDVANPDFIQSCYQSADLLPHFVMVFVATTVYLIEWIHRKLMERRIHKLRTFLGTSLERLRAADARRDQLEGTLKLTRAASAEYTLLLFLLLRARNHAGAHDQVQLHY